jgi:recombinational DNA repair ATPase RecF
MRDTIDIWDKLFIERAANYYLYRKNLVEFIQENTESINLFLQEKYSLVIKYITKVDLDDMEKSMLSYLKENRERDITTGHTYI